jgi:hypothetical protein
MDHVEGSFKGVRNANLYHQAWLPEGNVSAVLLIVHGLHIAAGELSACLGCLAVMSA